MNEQWGTIIDVSTVNVGDYLVADAAAAATTLFVADAALFDELGNQVTVNGVTYAYIAVDLVLNSITLTTGLTAAAVIDDRVDMYPPKSVKLALIDFGIDESDAIQAIVPHNLVSAIADGMRDEADREPVLVEERSPGELYVKDLPAKPAEVTAQATEMGAAVDLDTYMQPGVFMQSNSPEAVAGANYPLPWAGILEVFTGPVRPMVVQRYTAYRNDQQVNIASVWSRAYATETWSPWAPLYDDTGWITTIASVAVASTGWTVDQVALRRINKEVHFRVFVTKITSGITVPAGGDITNFGMFQFVAAYRPGGSVTQGVVSGSGGRTISALIQTDGIVVLTATGDGTNIDPSDQLAVGGVYLMG